MINNQSNTNNTNEIIMMIVTLSPHNSTDTCKMEQCITQVFDICKKMSVNTLL